MTHEMEMAERGLVLLAQSAAQFSITESVRIRIDNPSPDVLAYANYAGERLPPELWVHTSGWELTFGNVKIIVISPTKL